MQIATVTFGWLPVVQFVFSYLPEISFFVEIVGQWHIYHFELVTWGSQLE